MRRGQASVWSFGFAGTLRAKSEGHMLSSGPR